MNLAEHIARNHPATSYIPFHIQMPMNRPHSQVHSDNAAQSFALRPDRDMNDLLAHTPRRSPHSRRCALFQKSYSDHHSQHPMFWPPQREDLDLKHNIKTMSHQDICFDI